MPRNIRTSSKKLQAAANQAEALRFRLDGLSFKEVGEKLGLSPGHCCKLVQRALEEFEAASAERIALWRRLELARLENALRRVMPKANAGDLRTIDRVVRLIEAECKLLGLDAPTRVAPTNPDGTREYKGGGLASLLRLNEREAQP